MLKELKELRGNEVSDAIQAYSDGCFYEKYAKMQERNRTT
jgi:hypothetical protein